MIVGVLKEIIDGENRVAVTPQTVKDLLKSNLEVHIQSGAGELSFISDAAVSYTHLTLPTILLV
mgnify:CR=1 FL=1